MKMKFFKSSIILIVSYLFILSSCVTEDSLSKPVLGTTEVSIINEATAYCTSMIKSDGGANITARGVCWSTSVNPTVNLTTKTVNGSGIGSFSSTLTGLTANTKYYIRAYATNSVGTTYGKELSLKTTQLVADLDGNLYNVVTIGTQVWMVQNLKTTKYRDGTSIPNVTDAVQWNVLTTGAYCDYNNIESNSATNGRLYNWYAVINSHNIAPTGWHVATNAEWTTLTTYLGGESVAGGKLKESNTTHWTSPNTGATNESGFSALPGGYRSYNGEFIVIGSVGAWWSTSEYSTYYAWLRNMIYNNSSVNSGLDTKSCGFSVRCLRDF